MEIYTSDSSDSDSRDQKTLNYGRLKLTTEDVEDNILRFHKTDRECAEIETMFLNHNNLSSIPLSIVKFANLQVLDVSSNCLTTLPDIIVQCPLRTLVAKNNYLTNESLPKSLLSKTGQMRELNLSGNLLTQFPEHVLELKGLKFLYLGGNKITTISKDIKKLPK